MSKGIENSFKICTSCKIEKPISHFYKFKNSGKERMRAECSLCVKKKKRERERKTNKEYEDWYKKIPKKCEKCGETRPYLIDFHHTNPLLKNIEISTIRSKSWSLKKKIETAKEEMRKCIQLCSNCHREFHYLERHYDITLEEYL